MRRAGPLSGAAQCSYGSGETDIGMKIHDSILGLLFAMLGCVILFTVSGYPKMPGQDVGPAMFPGISAVLLIVFGLALIIRARLLGRDRRLLVLGDWAGSPRHVLAGLSIIGGCAAYALMSNTLGFLIITPPLLLVWHLAFGVRLPTALTSAVLTTAITWAVFYKGLGVPLPWGLLKSYAF